MAAPPGRRTVEPGRPRSTSSGSCWPAAAQGAEDACHAGEHRRGVAGPEGLPTPALRSPRSTSPSRSTWARRLAPRRSYDAAHPARRLLERQSGIPIASTELARFRSRPPIGGEVRTIHSPSGSRATSGQSANECARPRAAAPVRAPMPGAAPACRSRRRPGRSRQGPCPSRSTVSEVASQDVQVPSTSVAEPPGSTVPHDDPPPHDVRSERVTCPLASRPRGAPACRPRPGY